MKNVLHHGIIETFPPLNIDRFRINEDRSLQS